LKQDNTFFYYVCGTTTRQFLVCGQFNWCYAINTAAYIAIKISIFNTHYYLQLFVNTLQSIYVQII